MRTQYSEHSHGRIPGLYSRDTQVYKPKTMTYVGVVQRPGFDLTSPSSSTLKEQLIDLLRTGSVQSNQELSVTCMYFNEAHTLFEGVQLSKRSGFHCAKCPAEDDMRLPLIENSFAALIFFDEEHRS